jgi:hypothetical protein
MRTARIASIGLALLTVVRPSLVVAHHSAAYADFGKQVDVTGIVLFIDVANPHLALTLRVTDEKGTRDIKFEGHSRANLYRAGWREDTVKVGDKVTIRIAPNRDGTDGGYVTSLGTPAASR